MDIQKIIDLAQSNIILSRCLEDIYIILTTEKTSIPETNIPIFNEILKELKTLKEKTKKTS